MNMQENVQNTREAYRLFTQGDINGILNLYHDDIEFVFPGPADIVPLSGNFRGKDQVRQFFDLVNENLEFSSFEPQKFIAHEDMVVVTGHNTGTVRKTGKSFEEDWVHISTFRDGKVFRWQAFVDTARMVEDFTAAKMHAV